MYLNIKESSIKQLNKEEWFHGEHSSRSCLMLVMQLWNYMVILVSVTQTNLVSCKVSAQNQLLSKDYFYLNLPTSKQLTNISKNPFGIESFHKKSFKRQKNDVSKTKYMYLPTKRQGFYIFVNTDNEDKISKITKRDQVGEGKINATGQDDEIQKDIYDQLKTRFEKIEHHLASFTKQANKEEPQVRVIVISPKVFNGSEDKSLSLLDLENAAAFSKDNLFVKELSGKEYDDTFGNVLKKNFENGVGPFLNNKGDESDRETKELKDIEAMSPLLSDKDTLNEVIREINLLRNYSRDDNFSTFDEGERNQATNILDDVVVMGKTEDDHSTSHEKEFHEAKSQHKVDDSISKERNSVNLDTEIERKKMDDDALRKETKIDEQEPFNRLKNPTSTGQIRNEKSQNYQPTADITYPTKYFHELKKEIKPNRKGSKSNTELLEKEVDKANDKRNISQSEESLSSKIAAEQKDKILLDSIKVVDKQKAEAIIEFLNKDPLEVWRYSFKNLHALDLNSTLLRSGLVNAGNIERLKGVMRRALEGKSITISIVGGSISAGGGLYKDEKSISGLYYKGLIDWWQKMITPLTGADIIVNNVAIGSIGTDYFSYCVKNHIANESDIVLWELSANDYNRYKMQPTKGARPLERFTRMVLELPRKPALLYINFFKGVDYKTTRESCPDFEDQGEDIIAHYYKIPSLSWRAMVCSGLVNKRPGHGMEYLFSMDEYHPSLRGHAQMSLLILLHLRHVMRAVLQWAIAHDGFVERFEDHYIIPEPLFMGPRYPEPLCWSLISPDLNQKLTNSLFVRVKNNDGFKLEYATNFPIRFDKVVCWKAEVPHAEMTLQFFIPDDYGPGGMKRERSEVAITTHTRWGGSATLWIDEKFDRNIVIKEGREHDPGKRTQVDSLINDVGPGYHALHVRAHESGFCLSAIMIDSS